MEFKTTSLEGILILSLEKHGDHRGFFSETYNAFELKKVGMNISFVQDNQSLSEKAGTLRGLHYQAPPFAQDKLIRVTRGSIMDIAVDIRKGSPTFGNYIAEIISAEKWNQILVPKGFAHGFVTLEDSTEVIYKVSDYYAPDFDFGIKWNDPDLAIDWGVDEASVVISKKDQNQPLFNEISTPFTYEVKQ